MHQFPKSAIIFSFIAIFWINDWKQKENQQTIHSHSFIHSSIYQFPFIQTDRWSPTNCNQPTIISDVQKQNKSKFELYGWCNYSGPMSFTFSIFLKKWIRKIIIKVDEEFCIFSLQKWMTHLFDFPQRMGAVKIFPFSNQWMLGGIFFHFSPLFNFLSFYWNLRKHRCILNFFLIPFNSYKNIISF